MAQTWVDLYRAAQRTSSGRLCLNPDDEPEIQTWIDGHDPEHLLKMLAQFATHGTFQCVGETFNAIGLLPMRYEYREGRRSGQTHESMVQSLAEKYHSSPRTIERKVRNDKS